MKILFLVLFLNVFSAVYLLAVPHNGYINHSPRSICLNQTKETKVTWQHKVPDGTKKWVAQSGTINNKAIGSITSEQEILTWSTVGEQTIVVKIKYMRDDVIVEATKTFYLDVFGGIVITGSKIVCLDTEVEYSASMCDSTNFPEGQPQWDVTGGTVVSQNSGAIKVKWSTVSTNVGDKIVKASSGGAFYEYKVTVAKVEVLSGLISTQTVTMNLKPNGLSGNLKITCSSETNPFTVYENEQVGSDNKIDIKIDIDSIPEGLYDGFLCEWLEGGCSSYKASKFRALGLYRHSQYNTPNEASCDGDPVNVYITDSKCKFVASTLKANFVKKVILNGSGVSINHGNIQIEVFCLTNANAPADATGKSYRGNTAVINGHCGAVNATTVAINKNHPYLKCSDSVYISTIGKKTVTDWGGQVANDQLDNFTLNNACAGILDLGNFKTFQIFE